MEELKRIRARVLERITKTPIASRVLSGEADRSEYAGYLTNVWHYAQHSAIVIGAAGARAVTRDPELAHYLLKHAQEELGHDAWALEDLARLGVDEATVRASRPVPSCAAMVGYEYYVAAHWNPVALFGWLFVLESMGDDLGHRVASAIRSALGDEAGVRFLHGHGDADEEHTAEIIEQIRTNVRAEDMPDVVHVAEVVAELYVRTFEELSEA